MTDETCKNTSIRLKVPIGGFKEVSKQPSARWLIFFCAAILIALTGWSVQASIAVEALMISIGELQGGSTNFLAAPNENPIDLSLLLTIVPLCITISHVLTTRPGILGLNSEKRSNFITWLQVVQLSILASGVLLQVSMSLFSEDYRDSAAHEALSAMGRNLDEPEAVHEALTTFPFYWRAVLAVFTQETAVYLLFVFVLAVIVGLADQVLRQSDYGEELVEDGTKRRNHRRLNAIQTVFEAHNGRVAKHLQMLLQIDFPRLPNCKLKKFKVQLTKPPILWKLRLTYLFSVSLYTALNVIAWIPVLIMGEATMKGIAVCLYFSLLGVLGAVSIAQIGSSVDLRGAGMVILAMVFFVQFVMVLNTWISSSNWVWSLLLTIAVWISFIWMLLFKLVGWLMTAPKKGNTPQTSKVFTVSSIAVRAEKPMEQAEDGVRKTKSSPGNASAKKQDTKEKDSECPEYYCLIDFTSESSEQNRKLNLFALNVNEALFSIYRTMRNIARTESQIKPKR